MLVVDDDPATRLLLKKIFSQEGFNVDVAAGGTEGLKLTLTREYDVILLDLVMPQPDGQAVLHQISHVAPELLRKIITLAEYSQQAVAIKTYAMLVKPLDLYEALRLANLCTGSSSL